LKLASRSVLIAVLAVVPSIAYSQCSETRNLNECELALFETATILDGKNKEVTVLLNSCNAKLETRTATVIRSIVTPCPLLEKEEQPWGIYAATLATSLLIGLLSGLILR
tara:strand:- start:188 stop:517 length:330 start_codon:yes stop_codon:yes gene_type:complete